MNELNRCEHTEPALDADGKLQGSWQDRREGNRIEIVCRYCNKLFGYRSEEYVQQQLEYERRYREQLVRQSCPGCGEVPLF